MSIHINPAHKGLLHKKLGIPEGKPIPRERLVAAEKSKDVSIKKEAVFALNARGFDHSRT